MKRFAFVCFVMITASLKAETTLVWSDEFEYTGLPDPSKWSYDTGGNGWGNNELQYYTSNRLENARVENGILTIEARKESFSGRGYTSARLVTRNNGDWLYGKFEIRAKLPFGRGTWPAIWMLPTDWEYGGWPDSGEIDIMEHVGYDMDVVHGTVHTLSYNHTMGTQVGSSVHVDNVDTDFHVYSVEWRPDRIDAFVDGEIYFTFSNEGTGFAEWPFDKRFYMILNIAIGGNWGGVQGVDDTIFPQKMEVDYVRVYSIDNYDYSAAQPIPGRLEAESFSNQYGIRLEQTLDTGGGANAAYLGHGDWMEYRLSVPRTGTYLLKVRGASPDGSARLTIATGTEQLTSGTIPATGGWQTWATSEVGQIMLLKGETTLRATINSPVKEDLNINWFELELVSEDPTAGYGAFEEYPMEVYWIDTGNWLGWANVSHYPWVYLSSLGKYTYAADQWVYIPR